MPTDSLHIKSISQIHEMSGLSAPTHPLITVLDASQIEIPEELVGIKISTGFYSISLKDTDCDIDYGKKHYDFDEGSLIFTAPNQVMTVNEPIQKGEATGWMLYFHPDLIRSLSLGEKIDDYTFFSYSVHEALHLSAQEERILGNCIEMIQEEINLRIDNHSQQVLVSHIELLLNLCKRYYERQFNTRKTENIDIISKVERLLRNYFKDGKIAELGQPSVQYLADQNFLSPGYLSDLLKKETGKTAKDYINEFLVEKAKDMLLSTDENINSIAYDLGFNYPHYFSRLFKRKTGMTPVEYRSQAS